VVLNEGVAPPTDIDIAHDLGQIGRTGISPRTPHGIGTMHDQLNADTLSFIRG
jgi:hypothetical protein